MTAEPISAKRIMVYGVTGTGKTTLARSLGERLRLPWHSMDDLTFEPNWVQVSEEEQRRRVTEICAGEEWIIDTAYGAWLDVPLARVELIVGLDYPRWVSLSRLMRRTFRRLFDGQTICNGNRESLKTLFSRSSIILWHFKSFQRKRDRIRNWEGGERPQTLRFTNPSDLARWLETLETGQP